MKDCNLKTKTASTDQKLAQSYQPTQQFETQQNLISSCVYANAPTSLGGENTKLLISLLVREGDHFDHCNPGGQNFLKQNKNPKKHL